MFGDLGQVLRHYPLGELTDAHRIEQGFVNENWVITTTDGRFFLKRGHRDNREPRLIRVQHQLMEHLRDHSFPAPRIVPTSKGQTFLLLVEDWFEIQEYIDGEPYDHDHPAHLEEAAVTLGRYHRSVVGFAPRILRSLGDLYTPPVISVTLNNLVSVWGFDSEPELAHLARKLEAEVSRLSARFAAHGVLPNLVIHGDYYAGNLIFRGDRIVGVVDYDRARWHPRLAEIAEALVYFASPRPGPLKHIVYSGVLSWEPFSRFLESYAAAHPLEKVEIQALPDYVSGIWISWSLRRLLEKGSRPEDAVEALQEVLLLADWARTNAEQMAETARALVKL
jgi:homoserine kinase type II